MINYSAFNEFYNFEMDMVHANILVEGAISELMKNECEYYYDELDFLFVQNRMYELYKVNVEDKNESDYFKRIVKKLIIGITNQCTEKLVPLKMYCKSDDDGNISCWVNTYDLETCWWYFLLQYGAYPYKKENKSKDKENNSESIDKENKSESKKAPKEYAYETERIPRYFERKNYYQSAYESIIKNIIEKFDSFTSKKMGEIFVEVMKSIFSKYKIECSEITCDFNFSNYKFKELSLFEIFEKEILKTFHKHLCSINRNLKHNSRKIKLDKSFYQKKFRIIHTKVYKILNYNPILNNLEQDFFEYFRKEIEKKTLDEIIKLTGLSTPLSNENSILLFINDLYKVDSVFKIFKINQIARHKKRFYSKDSINKIINSNSLSYFEFQNLNSILNKGIFFNKDFIKKALSIKSFDLFAEFEYIFFSVLYSNYKNNQVYEMEFKKYNLDANLSGLISYSIIKATERTRDLLSVKTQNTDKTIIKDYYANFFNNKYLVNYYFNLDEVKSYLNDNKENKRYISFLINRAFEIMPPKI